MRSISRICGLILLIPFALSTLSCESDEAESSEPMLVVKFRFDKTQQRLDNSGRLAVMPGENAAMTPELNAVAADYLELSPDEITRLGDGAVIYRAPVTAIGGGNAIDFGKSEIVRDGQTAIKIPLKEIAAGNYNWVRVSIGYQNYTIDVRHSGKDYKATVASFIGSNTYIGSHAIGNNFFDVNANRPQGYWAFALTNYPYSLEGQAPKGATTVPNPLAASSPIPPGSSVVTGQIANKLVVTGKEKKDIVLTLSISVNNSFEWKEIDFDGKFEPAIGETIVDMGVRGLIPQFSVSK